MKIAFDIDGTLTIPAVNELAKFLIDNGAEVHVITGSLSNDYSAVAAIKREQHREKQLKLLGIVAEKVWICAGVTTAEVGMKKAQICSNVGIDIIFEDSEEFIGPIRKLSKTLVLDVRNK